MEIRLLPQDVILRAVLGNNRSISSSPTSAPAGVSVWCCWPSFTKTSQCAKHHRTSHCVLIPHWSAIFWIEHVWLVFLNLLLLILFEPLFSNGPFFQADKICLPKKWTLVGLARQQLALAVQWGCKDYYDDIGKRQVSPRDICFTVIFVNYIGLFYDWVAVVWNSKKFCKFCLACLIPSSPKEKSREFPAETSEGWFKNGVAMRKVLPRRRFGVKGKRVVWMMSSTMVWCATYNSYVHNLEKIGFLQKSQGHFAIVIL